jgi:hypothetical protein
VIPALTATGLLPPGEHPATWDELLATFGTNPHRILLLGGLRAGLESLRAAGCSRAWVDGSFVTLKDQPGDIDVLYDDAGLDWDELERIEPVLLEFDHHRAAQKRKFACEFFAATWEANLAGEPFLSFFQHDRNGDPKGIVRLNLKELP